MTQRTASIAELKARIAALDQERAAIAAEIATLEPSRQASASHSPSAGVRKTWPVIRALAPA